MHLSKTWLFYAFLGLVALFWILAVPFDEPVKIGVNVAFTVLSMMMSFVLSIDIWDITVTRGKGLSWQALTAKTGLFLLTLSFCLARAWGFVAGLYDYPRWMSTSALGTFFVFLMGVGLAGILYGFESVGDLQPRLTPRGAIIAAVVVGVAIGMAISKLPIVGT